MNDSTPLYMETEYNIQKAMEHRKEITRFIIAHRVSAVKNADEILYFESGEIVERGTHHELLKLRGRYFDIYRDQYRDVAEAVEKRGFYCRSILLRKMKNWRKSLNLTIIKRLLSYLKPCR